MVVRKQARLCNVLQCMDVSRQARMGVIEREQLHGRPHALHCPWSSGLESRQVGIRVTQHKEHLCWIHCSRLGDAWVRSR